MKFSKKAAVLTASYLLSAMAVLVGFVIVKNLETDQYRLLSENNYRHAYSELCSAVSEVDTSLQKCVYAASPSAITSACAEVSAKTASAEMALGVLPLAEGDTENTSAFLSRVGDYASVLGKKAASGQELSDGGSENLQALSKAASSLSASLLSLENDLDSGRISIRELKETQQEAEKSAENAVPTDLAGGLRVLESQFPDVPSLIYDGPFSQHIEQMTPRMLENEPDVSDEEALENAASFLDCNPEELSEAYVRDGKLPVIAFSTGEKLLEVTRQGGKILFYKDNRQLSDVRNISPEEAVETAKQFLVNKEFNSMSPTYWTVEDGRILINFAYLENGVLCYPDLIKVSVSLSDGEITGFESLGYLMSHTERGLSNSGYDPNQYASQIPNSLAILSATVTVIPTDGKNEVLCYEYKCENGDGKHCLIYLNTENGNEEKLLLLLEDENGTLVV